MSNIKWSCKYCTYENYPASLKCVICCQPKNSPVIEPPPLVNNKEVVNLDNENSANEPSHSRNFQNSDLIIDCTTNNAKNQASIYSNINNRNTTTEEVKPFVKCSSCTYMNNVVRTECEVCNFDLTSLEISGAAASNESTIQSNHKGNEHQNKWTCSNCTYQNWQKSLKCVMCQLPKFHELHKTNFAKAILPPNTSNDKETYQNESSGNDSKVNRLPMSLSVPNIASYRSRTSSSSSGSSSLSNNDDKTSEKYTNNAEKPVIRTSSSSTSRHGACSGTYLQRSASKSRISLGLRNDSKSKENFDSECSRHIKSRMKNSNLLFLKACIGVVENDLEAVDRYLSHGGSIARALTAEEVRILNRPSAFDVNHTLVHLAIRFRRHQIMALILQPEVTKRALKRCPSLVCPDLTDLISHEIYNSLRRRKGEFHCRYFCENVTFQLPLEITDLPSSFRELLLEELLDQDAQKELEDDGAINWCPESSGRLHALWNRSAGDCLLDSVLQATWGIFDKENILRRALAETLHDCSTYFYKRWKEWELMQARMLGYSLTERQCLQDWSFILSLAQQPGASLEHCHIFVLAHVLRRPVIVYSVKYLKGYRGDTLGYTKFQGVYLPFFWDQSFCWKSPVTLGYTRGHFSALVAMENDGNELYGGGAHYHRTNQQSSSQNAFLPLVDSDRKILPIHFTAPGEAVTEAERECLLYDWLDCHVTNSGILVARQTAGKRPPLVTRMLDQWLDHYRHLSIRRLGEIGDSEEE